MVSRGEVWWYEHSRAGRRPFLILTRDEAIAVLSQILGVPATFGLPNVSNAFLAERLASA